MIYMNWVMFGMLISWLYLGNFLLDYFLVKKNNKAVILDKQIKVLKNIKIKSIEQQKQYIELLDKKNGLYGSNVMKFVFIILMFIVFTITIDYIPDKFLYGYNLIFCIIVPIFYLIIVKEKDYKLYNYCSMFVMFIFFTGYIVIQKNAPLEFYGLRIIILYLLPILFIINMIIKVIKEKIFKRKKGE